MTVHCTHDEPGIGNGLISQVNFKMDPSQCDFIRIRGGNETQRSFHVSVNAHLECIISFDAVRRFNYTRPLE